MYTWQTCFFADAFQLYIQVCTNQIIARAVGEHSVRDFPSTTRLEPFYSLLLFVLFEQIKNVFRQHNTAFAPGCFRGISAMTKHGMKFTRQGLDDSLVLIEDENRFNPVADMLNTVRHDGTDRLAELAEIAGIAEDKTACLYLRKWLHQSVAMALNDDADP